MRLVFADTLYWGAILHPLDQYRAQVIRVREALGEIRLVTTDEVLTELLDGLAERGPHLRGAAARAIRAISSDRRVTVHPQSHASFLAGLRLYEQRNDKGYSLVDCISMTTMRRHRISEILTNSPLEMRHGTTQQAPVKSGCGSLRPECPTRKEVLQRRARWAMRHSLTAAVR